MRENNAFDLVFVFLICPNMLMICMNIYIVVYAVISHEICLKKDILYNCRTKIHRKSKNAKLSKRNPNQTNQRTTRPHSPTTPRFSAHARLPDNHENPQKLRHLLRTKHNLPATGNTGKERPLNQRMEHENRKTTKNLQTHDQRTNNSKLHRKLVESVVPENRNKQYTSD